MFQLCVVFCIFLGAFHVGCDRQTPQRTFSPPPPSRPSGTVRNSQSMDFIVLPSGSLEVRGGADANGARFQGTEVDGFHFAVLEVTQEEYERVMGVNPSQFQGVPRRPVENVSWVDAVVFCNRLSELEGLPPYYVQRGEDGSRLDDDGFPLPIYEVKGGPGYRLPTRAEWEYVARCGDRHDYGFGDDASQLGQHAWFTKNADRQTHTVGGKQASAWGTHDMHGNVWEWCWDEYSQHSGRIAKGGGWDSDAFDCSASGQIGAVRNLRNSNVGIRLARTPSAVAPSDDRAVDP